MSLRTYADPKLKIPGGDYRQDNGESYKAAAAVLLDETRRVSLYQLAFHDYVVGTWIWRDSNYQSVAFADKKDLYNILYGTMPMWRIDRALWTAHKDDFVASYRATAGRAQSDRLRRYDGSRMAHPRLGGAIYRLGHRRPGDRELRHAGKTTGRLNFSPRSGGWQCLAGERFWRDLSLRRVERPQSSEHYSQRHSRED